jgi:hypothetical protein
VATIETRERQGKTAHRVKVRLRGYRSPMLLWNA